MSEQNEQVLQTTREYPCGCSATGPGDVPAYCSTHGVHPNVEQANAALDALQQDLDAAVDAEPSPEDLNALEPEVSGEPVFGKELGDVTVDPSNNVFVNVGKATPKPEPIPNQYRAISGGQVVYAQKIIAFAYDKYGAPASVVLTDGTEKVRPRTHGFIPALGDYYVAHTPITELSTGVGYVEEPETAIIGKRLFESLYYPVQE